MRRYKTGLPSRGLKKTKNIRPEDGDPRFFAIHLFPPASNRCFQHTQAVKNLLRHRAPFVPPVAPRFWRSPSAQEGKIRGVATLEASAELSIFSL